MSDVKPTATVKSTKNKIDYKEVALNLGMIIATSALAGFCTAAGAHVYQVVTRKPEQKNNLLVMPGGKTGTNN